jgi:hypothetical protein
LKRLLPLSALAVLAVFLTVSFVPTSARAATCPEFGTLSDHTSKATSLGRPDKDALLAKIDEASAKLAQGKLVGARTKLLDYRAKLLALYNAPKPKISPDDFSQLSGDVGAAIDCVEDLIATP